MARASSSIFSREIVLEAIKDSFPKLDPRLQLKNPVMFIVELGSVITTGIFFLDLVRRRGRARRRGARSDRAASRSSRSTN